MTNIYAECTFKPNSFTSRNSYEDKLKNNNGSDNDNKLSAMLQRNKWLEKREKLAKQNNARLEFERQMKLEEEMDEVTLIPESITISNQHFHLSSASE